MNESTLASNIRSIVKDSSGCLCGSRESCEACNPYSEYNKLRDRIIEVIDGPKPAPDYGAVVSVELE